MRHRGTIFTTFKGKTDCTFDPHKQVQRDEINLHFRGNIVQTSSPNTALLSHKKVVSEKL